MTSKRHGTLFRDSLAILPSYVVPGLVSLASVPLLFAILGAPEYGRWALMYAIGNGVPQLTTSWLEAVTLRFGHRGRWVARSSLLTGSLVLSGLAGYLMAVLLIPGSSAPVSLVAAVLTVTVGAYLVAIARLQSQMRFGQASAVASLRAVAGGVASVSIAAGTGSAMASIAGLAVAFGLCSMVALGNRGQAEARRTDDEATRGGDPVRAPHVRSAGSRGHWRYGTASVLWALALYVLNVADRFILAALRPIADVGVYAATYAIVDLVFRMPPAVLLAAIRPRMFRAWDAAAHGQSVLATIQAAVLLSWMAALFTLAMVVLARFVPALPLALGIVGPLCIGIGAFGVGSAFGTLLSAMERQGRLAAAAASAAVTNVVLNIALIPPLGIFGAALATVIAFVLYLCINAAAVRHTEVPRALIVAIAGSTVAAVVATLASDPSRWPWAPATTLALLAVTAPAVLASSRRLLLAMPG